MLCASRHGKDADHSHRITVHKVGGRSRILRDEPKESSITLQGSTVSSAWQALLIWLFPRIISLHDAISKRRHSLVSAWRRPGIGMGTDDQSCRPRRGERARGTPADDRPRWPVAGELQIFFFFFFPVRRSWWLAKRGRRRGTSWTSARVAESARDPVARSGETREPCVHM